MLDADGAEVHRTDRVWLLDGSGPYTVDCNWGDGMCSIVELAEHVRADQLTHQRPVLDADGVPIREGDTVYLLPGEWCGEYPLRYYSAGDEMVVKELYIDHEFAGVLKCVGDSKCACFPLPCQLTHRAPVLAADGEPLEVGQTVYHIADGKKYTVEELFKDGAMVTPDGITGGRCRADYLTHERPDSWARLEGDAEKNPCDYFGFDGEETCGKCPASGKNCEQTMARDIVRRAKALAERERGE